MILSGLQDTGYDSNSLTLGSIYRCKVVCSISATFESFVCLIHQEIAEMISGARHSAMETTDSRGSSEEKPLATIEFDVSLPIVV